MSLGAVGPRRCPGGQLSPRGSMKTSEPYEPMGPGFHTLKGGIYRGRFRFFPGILKLCMYIPIYVFPECGRTLTSTYGGSVITRYFDEPCPHQYPADEGVGGGGVPIHLHGRSHITIASCIPRVPERSTSCFHRPPGMGGVLDVMHGGCTRCHAWPPWLYEHRPSHPYVARTKHFGFSPTRQTSLPSNAECRGVSCASHEG